MAVRDTIESDPALSRALLPMLHARQMLFETFMELDGRVRKAPHEGEVCTHVMGIPELAIRLGSTSMRQARRAQNWTCHQNGGWDQLAPDPPMVRRVQ